MVFMEDSERAADIARERGVSAGLHLNLTTAFSAPGTPSLLMEHQHRLSVYLQRRRIAQAIYNPGLSKSFEFVVAKQCEEFARLYGSDPGRLDGHHHMHLCSNVLLGNLLPPGTVVRRNFSFQTQEKGFANRFYRRVTDHILSRRHRLTDFFFSLPPLDPERLERIFALARHSVVEVETHPVHPREYEFLSGGEILRQAGDDLIAPSYAVSSN